MNEPSKHEAPIPQELQDQLETFRRRLWRIKIAEAVLAGFFGLIISFLLVFLSDRFWDTPRALIVAIFIGGTLLFAVFAPYWIHRWVWGHRRGVELAKLISRRYPRFGDQLLGIIELQDQTGSDMAQSGRLREAAMRQVADEASRRDFETAVPAARHRKWSLIVVGCAGIAVAALVIAPQAGMNALKRWLMPFSDVERYTFTALEELPDELAVPSGESFPFTATLSSTSENSPVTAFAKVGDGEWVEATLNGRKYEFQMPGQQARDELLLKVGDVRKTIVIDPRARPSITDAIAKVQYPDYLERGSDELPLRGGVLSVLAGSEVRISAEGSGGLAKGWFTPPVLEGEEKPETLTMEVDGNRILSPAFIAKDGGMASFEWQDSYGLRGAAPYRMQVETLEDFAPSIYTEGVDRTKMILQSETLEFKVIADDDFGLKQIGLEWVGEFTKPSAGSPAEGEMILEKGNPKATRLSFDAAFSPAALAIAPQKIVLRAFAEDYMPGRERVYSQEIVIYILDKVDHAQMLKNRLERMLGELEADARREQNNLTENQLLEQETGEELQKEKNREKLQESAQKEADNREKVAELKEKMEELFKEANRNDRVEKETMERLSGLMQKLDELSKKDMKEVEKKLADAANKRNTPEKTKKDLQEGVQKQQKVLEKMREAIKEANEANENFEASTFVARLKQAAGDEDSVAQTLAQSAQRMIGLLIEEASPGQLDFIKGVNSTQLKTTSDISWIQDDLQNFSKRSDKPVYSEILKQMKLTEIDRRLAELTNKLDANNGLEGRDKAMAIAEDLRKWAKLIDDSRKEEGGGGGGGGGSQDNLNDQDFEFMLRVMKMIQTEQDLRAKTRAIEQMRRAASKQPADPS